MIIAGGKGKRLMPLTYNLPKPLLTVNGKSPLERSVNALCHAGVDNIGITTGYLWEKTEKCIFEKNDSTGFKETEELNITYYREETPMGTAGMIFKILPYLQENFFVVSGDVVFDFSLKEMFDFHLEKKAAVTIAAVRSQNPTYYGTIVSKNGIITAFREKPSWKQVISTRINAGIYIINRKILEKYGCEFSDFASELFPFLLSKGETLSCFESEGYWCDMGTPESYHECNMYFSKGENVLGKYVSFDSSSLISRSIVMNGTKIGAGTKITSSIIAEGVSVGRNCILENAVIGAHALICDNAVIKGYVSEETIVGKGETVSRREKEYETFSDSGKISLSENDLDKAYFWGVSLQKMAENRQIILFHDNSSQGKSTCDVISEGIFHSGGSAVTFSSGFLPVVSFSAIKRKAISIFAESNDTDSTITITVFDEMGITLSREEQIICEKAYKSEKAEVAPRHAEKDNMTEWNPFSSYVLSKSAFIEDLSQTDIVLSNTAPCRLLSKIIKKKNAKYEFTENAETRSKGKDYFFIDEKGTEIFCITKKDVKISKTGLISIAAKFYPQKNVSLPEYAPESLKALILSNGGSYHVFGDEIGGRVKADGFYNFEDGISIALAVLCASFKSGLSIDEMLEETPIMVFAERTVLFNGNKGNAFEKLSKAGKEFSELGIQRRTEKGKASIIPQYKNAFKIFAEAVSAEAAEELLEKALEDISELSEK